MTGPAVRAGLAYFALVFLAGSVLGFLRVTVLAPATGDLAAVMIELPLMLWISWIACATVVRRFAVPSAAPARLAMGGSAFLWLIAAELALSALAFGRSPATYLASLTEPSGALGIAGQALFALIPWLHARGAART